MIFSKQGVELLAKGIFPDEMDQCMIDLAVSHEKLRTALERIISESYNDHWHNNDDGTSTNHWPAWARKFAFDVLNSPVKTANESK